MESAHDLTIEGLTKVFDAGKSRRKNGNNDGVRAVDQLSLTIKDGEFLVLLGPSGCGKTTLLRCLAGLERPSEGRIRFDDRVLFDASTHTSLRASRRNLGMVFQNFSLWPHMSVARNVAYPLRVRGEGTHEERMMRVRETLALVECEELIDRYPAQLSGGQQQRIALARALVAKPDLLLFDEPLSNLDFRLRSQLRAELAELHERLAFTAVFVTHDQTEAFQLADRVAVMNRGRIEQLSDPETVHNNPASPYVASFLGIENRLRVTRSDDGWTIENGPRHRVPMRIDSGGSEFELFLRAEDIRVMTSASESTQELDRHVRLGVGEIVARTFAGGQFEHVVRIGDLRINATLHADEQRFGPGDRVAVAFDPRDALVYGPIETGSTGLVTSSMG